MKSRVTALMALTLSFIYCGLGQIYRRRIVKGINFAVLYSLLIVSYFFSDLSPFHRGLNLFIILVMWIVGMVDAYLNQRSRKSKKVQDVMSFSIVVCAMITLLVPHMLISHEVEEPRPLTRRYVPAPPVSEPVTDIEDMTTSPETKSEADVESKPEEAVEEKAIETAPMSLYEPDFSIEDYNIKPVIAEPGATLNIEYIINSTKDTTLGLGFSIQRFNTHKWLSDTSNDLVVNVEAGSGKYYRNFVIPNTLRPGEYNIICGLWDSNYKIKYYSRQSDKALNIVSPADISDGSDLFSVQVATFRKPENAEKMSDELLSKGYPARIEHALLLNESFYVVLVGESYSRENAIVVAKELQEREGFSGMVIRRRADKGERLFSDALFR